MIFTLLAIMMASALSLLMLGTILSQKNATVFDQKQTTTIGAAEAGVDAVLTEIRAATKPDPVNVSKTVGNIKLLPCGTNAVSGVVTDQLTYRATVRYYWQDPTLQSKAWRDSVSNQVSCSTLTAGSTTQPTFPRFVLINSMGFNGRYDASVGDTGDREIETTYDLQITNENISGGPIQNYKDGSSFTLMCWDAGSSPSATSQVKVAACDPNKSSQQWAWRKDYTIALANTVPTASPLCARLNNVSGSGTATVGKITLGACPTVPRDVYGKVTPTNSVAPFLFGYDDNGHFTVRASISGNAVCPYQATLGTAGDLSARYTNTCNAGQNSASAWQPDAKVGAGSVGDNGPLKSDVIGKNLQWVNYGEFGRCFDVSNQSTSEDRMIAYPCKQDAYGAVSWNQRLTWFGTETAPGLLKTNTSGSVPGASNVSGDFCLQSASASSTVNDNGFSTNGRFALMKACSSTVAAQKWTVNREVAGNTSKSYTVVDSNGLCLSLKPIPGGTRIAQWSGVVTETCDGSARQKWNAPPDPTKSSLRDTVEVNG